MVVITLACVSVVLGGTVTTVYMLLIAAATPASTLWVVGGDAVSIAPLLSALAATIPGARYCVGAGAGAGGAACPAA